MSLDRQSGRLFTPLLYALSTALPEPVLRDEVVFGDELRYGDEPTHALLPELHRL